MNNKLYPIVFFLIFFTLKNITPAYSKQEGLSFLSDKNEELIFLPIKTATIDKMEREFYEAVFIEALSKKNTIYSGSRVIEKINKIGSSNQICTSENCLRQVAIEFNGALIGQAKIDKDDKNLYTISFIVKDVFEDKTIYSKTSFCDNCNKVGMSNKIKALFVNQKKNIDEEKVNKEEESSFNFDFGINARMDYTKDFVQIGKEREVITPFGADLRMFIGKKDGINFGIGYFSGTDESGSSDASTIDSGLSKLKGYVEKKEVTFYLGKNIQTKNNSFHLYLSYIDEELTGSYTMNPTSIDININRLETIVRGKGIGTGFWGILKEKGSLGQSISYGIDIKYMKYEYEEAKAKGFNIESDINVGDINDSIYVVSIFTGIAF